ncbi:hypothetical protein FGO68_gene6270 [Halteria grandinella]|uniref:Uncharacterized protein n=1 Tax=Halteria grandinella TaxID=5974 RepID=A0A8J8P524_HALGN|nr:hypothetical protein FGO68_gene6270 [Halteria grandinella]
MKREKDQFKTAVLANIQNLNKKEIGKKLVDGIKKVKNIRSSSSRINFELLQNAMDCAFQRQQDQDGYHVAEPVSARFLLDQIEIDGRMKKFLKFSHNGRAFTFQDLMRVVLQTSIKERPNAEEFQGENEEQIQAKLEAYVNNQKQCFATIGRFGTGFLNTHLLSLTIFIGGAVDLCGVLENDEQISFKKFEIQLDRTNWESIDKMNLATEKNIQDLQMLNNMDDQEFEPGEFVTDFTYFLQDQESENKAEEAIKALIESLPQILAFNQLLFQVEITNKIFDIPELKQYSNAPNPQDSQTIVFQREQRIKLRQDLQVNCPQFDIVDIIKGTKNASLLIVHFNQMLEIAFNLDKNDDGRLQFKQPYFQEVRVFAAFPLVGSEQIYKFPFIFNSISSFPDEPRTQLMLLDPASLDVKLNRKLFEYSVKLYKKTLEHVFSESEKAKYISPENICKVQDWVPICAEEAWYVSSILRPMMDAVCEYPIIKSRLGEALGILKIQDVFLPSIYATQLQGKEEMGAEKVQVLLDLMHGLYGRNHQVICDDIQAVIEWSKIVENPNWLAVLKTKNANFKLYKIEDIIKAVHSCGSLKTLTEQYQFSTQEESIAFLNSLYSALTNCTVITQDIRNLIINKPNSNLIFLNQYGKFQQNSNLYFENSIEENIKSILRYFGYDIKEELLHRDIYQSAKYFIQKERRQDEIINKIMLQAFQKNGFDSENGSCNYQLNKFKLKIKDKKVLDLAFCIIQFEPELKHENSIKFLQMARHVQQIAQRLNDIRDEMFKEEKNEQDELGIEIDAFNQLNFQQLHKISQQFVLHYIQEEIIKKYTLKRVENKLPASLIEFEKQFIQRINVKTWLTNFYQYFEKSEKQIHIDEIKLCASSILLNQLENFNALIKNKEFQALRKDDIVKDIKIKPVFDDEKENIIAGFKGILNIFLRRQRFENPDDQDTLDIENYLIHSSYEQIFAERFTKKSDIFTFEDLCKQINLSLSKICFSQSFPKYNNDIGPKNVDQAIKDLDQLATNQIDEQNMPDLTQQEQQNRTKTEGDRFLKKYIPNFFSQRQIILLHTRSKEELEKASLITNGTQGMTKYYKKYNHEIKYVHKRSVQGEYDQYNEHLKSIVSQNGNISISSCPDCSSKISAKEGAYQNIKSTVFTYCQKHGNKIDIVKEVTFPFSQMVYYDFSPRFDPLEYEALFEPTSKLRLFQKISTLELKYSEYIVMFKSAEKEAQKKLIEVMKKHFQQ